MNYAIRLPHHISYGPGSVKTIGESIARFKPGAVIIFTDQNLRQLGMTKGLEDHVKAAGIPYTLIDDIVPEPAVADVERALSRCGGKTGLIIGIGGGSVMDTAKLASLLLGSDHTVRDLLKDPLMGKKTCPSVMIPTTCGTGSEATGNSIVAIPEEQTKKGIVNPHMIPDGVILDVELISKLPANIVAATGVDALAHCVECYTGNKATPLSDLYAAQGARHLFNNIEKAYRDPKDLDARQDLLLGAFYGGVAITGSGTTAVHALSYPLGGRYHIPHGVSNAMLLSRIMRFNLDACLPQLASLCDAVYPERLGYEPGQKAEYILKRIDEIVKNTEIPTNLGDFGVKKEALDELVEAGSMQTRLLSNNRKAMSKDDIRGIYGQLL